MKYTDPEITKKDGPFNREIYSHPCYGMANFNIVSCTPGEELFGSSIRHNSIVRFEVHHADMERSLSRDWYFPRSSIVEFEMSYTQFAELIASRGTTGVPVTIRRTEKDGSVPGCHFENKRSQIKREIDAVLHENSQEARNYVDEIRDLFDNKASIGKKDREDILKKLEKFVRTIDEDAAYIYNMFDEQMDNTVAEAKGEVEAFTEEKVRSLGLQAMAEKGIGEMSPVSIDMKEDNDE